MNRAVALVSSLLCTVEVSSVSPEDLPFIQLPPMTTRRPIHRQLDEEPDMPPHAMTPVRKRKMDPTFESPVSIVQSFSPSQQPMKVYLTSNGVCPFQCLIPARMSHEIPVLYESMLEKLRSADTLSDIAEVGMELARYLVEVRESLMELAGVSRPILWAALDDEYFAKVGSAIPVKMTQEALHSTINPELADWLKWTGPDSIPNRLFSLTFNMDANRAYLAVSCSDEDLSYVAQVMIAPVATLTRELALISNLLNTRPIVVISDAIRAYRALPSTENLVKLVEILANPNMYPVTLDPQLLSAAREMGVKIVPDSHEWELAIPSESADAIPWIGTGLSSSAISALTAAQITADELRAITPPKSVDDGITHSSAISEALEIIVDSAERSVLVSNIGLFATLALQHATHTLGQFLVAGNL